MSSPTIRTLSATISWPRSSSVLARRDAGGPLSRVKFLIDAQLPARLAEFLNQAGHDAVHTVELPDGNRSTDTQIAHSADTAGRVVVTMDRDFPDGHLLAQSPRQLLVVATGDITYNELVSLFELRA